MTLHPDEQARELGQQLCSHVNGQYMDPNGIAMIAALLAKARQQALDEAAQYLEQCKCRYCLDRAELIRKLASQAEGSPLPNRKIACRRAIPAYSIYIKDQPISPAPNTSWASKEMAEACIPVYERDVPELKGKLEVRETCPPH